eukprot:tig00020610_g12036.t1
MAPQQQERGSLQLESLSGSTSASFEELHVSWARSVSNSHPEARIAASVHAPDGGAICPSAHCFSEGGREVLTHSLPAGRGVYRVSLRLSLGGGRAGTSDLHILLAEAALRLDHASAGSLEVTTEAVERRAGGDAAAGEALSRGTPLEASFFISLPPSGPARWLEPPAAMEWGPSDHDPFTLASPEASPRGPRGPVPTFDPATPAPAEGSLPLSLHHDLSPLLELPHASSLPATPAFALHAFGRGAGHGGSAPASPRDDPAAHAPADMPGGYGGGAAPPFAAALARGERDRERERDARAAMEEEVMAAGRAAAREAAEAAAAAAAAAAADADGGEDEDGDDGADSEDSFCGRSEDEEEDEEDLQTAEDFIPFLMPPQLPGPGPYPLSSSDPQPDPAYGPPWAAPATAPAPARSRKRKAAAAGGEKEPKPRGRPRKKAKEGAEGLDPEEAAAGAAAAGDPKARRAARKERLAERRAVAHPAGLPAAALGRGAVERERGRRGGGRGAGGGGGLGGSPAPESGGGAAGPGPGPAPAPALTKDGRPRKKMGRPPLAVDESVHTRSNYERYFHMPINTVAAQLKACVTVIKKNCRAWGIKRWPQRKFTAMRHWQAKVREKQRCEGYDKTVLRQMRDDLQDLEDRLYRDPGIDIKLLTSEAKKILNRVPNANLFGEARAEMAAGRSAAGSAGPRRLRGAPEEDDEDEDEEDEEEESEEGGGEGPRSSPPPRPGPALAAPAPPAPRPSLMASAPSAAPPAAAAGASLAGGRPAPGPSASPQTFPPAFPPPPPPDLDPRPPPPSRPPHRRYPSRKPRGRADRGRPPGPTPWSLARRPPPPAPWAPPPPPPPRLPRGAPPAPASSSRSLQLCRVRRAAPHSLSPNVNAGAAAPGPGQPPAPRRPRTP